MRRLLAALGAALALGCNGAPPDRAVVVALPAGPESLLPHVSNEEFSISVLGNVFEPLVELDRSLAPQACLAESWYTEDDLTWVFRLRANVLRHDGATLRAADVVSAVERARKAPESKRAVGLNSVAMVEARDDRTVVIRTHFPTAALPNRLSNIPIWIETRAGEAPAGTGPYRIEQWVPGRHTVLRAFAQYHGRAPEVRALEFRVVSDVNERMALLRRGEVHLTIDVPVEAIDDLAADPGLRTRTEKGLRVVYLAMDTARTVSPYVHAPSNPFHDVRVRRALALAIDRERLVRGPLGGQAEVVDQMVAPAVFGYDDELPRRAMDVEAARRLLAEAGQAAGFRAALDFMPGKYRAVEAVVQALGEDLARVGVRLEPRGLPPAEFLNRIESQNTSLYLLGWMSTSGDAGLTYDYLLHTPGGGHGVDNGGGYSSPEVDRWIAESSGLLRPPDRRQLLHRVARRVHEDAPVVPLYRQTDIYAMARDLEFEPRIDRRIGGGQMRWSGR